MELPRRFGSKMDSFQTLESGFDGLGIPGYPLPPDHPSEILPHDLYLDPTSDKTLEAALARLSIVSGYDNPRLYHRRRLRTLSANLDLNPNPVNDHFQTHSISVDLPEEDRAFAFGSNDVGQIGTQNNCVGPNVDFVYNTLTPTSYVNTPRPWGTVSYNSASLGRITEYSVRLPFSNGDGLFADLIPNDHGMRNGSVGMKYKSAMSISSVSTNSTHPLHLERSQNYSSVSEMRGKILSYAKDQYGCRLLQRAMDSTSSDEVDIIFMEVIDHVRDLMLNAFGNYVIQKLVELCNEQQRMEIIQRLTDTDSRLVSICLNVHGTRAVQKLLDNIGDHTQISLLISALSPGAVALTKDMNGHHVIQYCLKHFSEEDNKYLLNEVVKNCFTIATDKCGCCVLQLCVDQTQGETRKRLVREIILNARHLAEDRYGNYVVQHVLELRIPEVTAGILRQLMGTYVSLSCNKYGSNVIEKCLTQSGEQLSTFIIWEMLHCPNVSMLLLDPYGNYVMQSALSVSKGFIRTVLLDLVERNSSFMRSNLYGKKILARFDKLKSWHHV